MKRIITLVLCFSLVLGLSGCAADPSLARRRDNSLSDIGEALQKGVEAENNKKLSENGSGGDSGLPVSDGNDKKASGGNNDEIFYNGDEWLDPSFNTPSIDWESSDWWSDEPIDGSGEVRQNGLSYGAHVPDESDLAEGDTTSAGGIDIDLTDMSATMVYAEVYFMMVYPERYIGKKIKADGMFATYYDEVLDKMYYACIVKDATECCAQGLEFALAEERKYPEEFPKEGEDVCVTGIFDTYMEGEDKYGVLRDAVMVYGEELK
ncbi:MAG: hypothetical protein K6F93_07215 [Lachnospiraceae bacterium]|nr:hypothetical protein [Lachnospiraceae bacterium]